MFPAVYMPRGGDRALVVFEDGNFAHNIYLPRGGAPSNVAAVLAAITPRLSRDRWDAGETAADFAAAVDPKVRPRLVHTEEFTRFVQLADLAFYVDHARSPGHRVEVYPVVMGIVAVDATFSGQLYQFTEWAAGQTGLERIVKKLVAFRYNGGSRVGEIRRVRVEKVVRESPDVVRIEGYDIDQDDLTNAYRQYSSDKITGEITLVA
jgi:hypothetical protein